MDYKQVCIRTNDASLKEVLIALLTEHGFEGFEEREEELLAYVSEKDFNESLLTEIIKPNKISYTVTDINKTNWNKKWEESFQPVIIEDFCTVRAHFHKMNVATPHEIIITPKMSFGTGHHATTRLVIRMMQSLDFRNKKVLDFGTGTGILAILAEQSGAQNVIALDNDEWSYENAAENAERNNAAHLSIRLGTLESLDESDFDIILANINRHILLQYMQALYHKISDDGIIIMSGLLQDDQQIITDAATSTGFHFELCEAENNWIALRFFK